MMRSVLAVLAAVVLAAGGGTAARADGRGDPTEWTLKSVALSEQRDLDETAVGNGATVLIELSDYSWSDLPQASKPRLELQWYRNGSWRTVPGTAVAVPDDFEHEDVLAWTQPYRTSAKREAVRYRFLSRPYSDATGSVTNTDASRIFTVHYDDQARSTGLLRKAYQTVRPYCPTTAITYSKKNEDAVGFVTPGVELIHLMKDWTGYSGADFRNSAIHECAHVLQWKNSGSTDDGYFRMRRDAKRIFIKDADPSGMSAPYSTPYKPTEHAADCSAETVEPDGYMGYGGWCDPAELAAGARLLQGGRY